MNAAKEKRVAFAREDKIWGFGCRGVIKLQLQRTLFELQLRRRYAPQNKALAPDWLTHEAADKAKLRGFFSWDKTNVVFPSLHRWNLWLEDTRLYSRARFVSYGRSCPAS